MAPCQCNSIPWSEVSPETLGVWQIKGEEPRELQELREPRELRENYDNHTAYENHKTHKNQDSEENYENHLRTRILMFI